MTKAKEILYGMSLFSILAGAMIIETLPLVAIGMLAVAGISAAVAGKLN